MSFLFKRKGSSHSASFYSTNVPPSDSSYNFAVTEAMEESKRREEQMLGLRPPNICSSRDSFEEDDMFEVDITAENIDSIEQNNFEKPLSRKSSRKSSSLNNDFNKNNREQEDLDFEKALQLSREESNSRRNSPNPENSIKSSRSTTPLDDQNNINRVRNISSFSEFEVDNLQGNNESSEKKKKSFFKKTLSFSMKNSNKKKVKNNEINDDDPDLIKALSLSTMEIDLIKESLPNENKNLTNQDNDNQLVEETPRKLLKKKSSKFSFSGNKNSPDLDPQQLFLESTDYRLAKAISLSTMEQEISKFPTHMTSDKNPLLDIKDEKERREMEEALSQSLLEAELSTQKLKNQKSNINLEDRFNQELAEQQQLEMALTLSLIENPDTKNPIPLELKQTSTDKVLTEREERELKDLEEALKLSMLEQHCNDIRHSDDDQPDVIQDDVSSYDDSGDDGDVSDDDSDEDDVEKALKLSLLEEAKKLRLMRQQEEEKEKKNSLVIDLNDEQNSVFHDNDDDIIHDNDVDNKDDEEIMNEQTDDEIGFIYDDTSIENENTSCNGMGEKEDVDDDFMKIEKMKKKALIEQIQAMANIVKSL